MLLAIVFLVMFFAVKPSWLRPLNLSHSAVESYIEGPNFGAKNVTCNGGSDISVESGKKFTCRDGSGNVYNVTMTDDNGTYTVQGPPQK